MLAIVIIFWITNVPSLIIHLASVFELELVFLLETKIILLKTSYNHDITKKSEVFLIACKVCTAYHSMHPDANWLKLLPQPYLHVLVNTIEDVV
jgi:hypothetical protein